MTYKAPVRSKIDNAAPVWVPNVKRMPLKRIQTIQNAGLCIVSGCVKMSAEEHLHTTAKMLFVSNHLQLLTAQYLVSALRPTRPLHSVVSSPAGPRDMKGRGRLLGSRSNFKKGHGEKLHLIVFTQKILKRIISFEICMP